MVSKSNIEVTMDAHQPNYSLVRVIAHGSFAIIYQAKSPSNQLVAVKRVFQDSKYRNRELEILQKLSKEHFAHPNILQILDYYFNTQSSGDVYLHIVSRLFPDTLASFI